MFKLVLEKAEEPSLVAQVVKHLSTMWETWIRSLGWEKGMATHSSILASPPPKKRKCRGTRDQIANTCWIIKKAKEFQKNIEFCFIDYTKTFECVDQNKLWEILKEMGIQDHLTCLLRNLYAH